MKVISEKQNLHRLSSPKRNVDTQRAKRFCGGRTYPNICRGDLGSPVFRICYNFRIVGAWRNLQSIFNFQVTFGVRHWVLCPWLRIHKIYNAHPRLDTSTLQPVPETHLGFTKSQGLYVPASIKTLSTYPRKSPLLLHKKCNNCRNVAKLKYKSFVCTSLWGEFCAG